MDYIAITTDNYLEHHGILGQKWGIRRYQNADGSLTDIGKKRKAQIESAQEKGKNAARNISNTAVGLTMAAKGAANIKSYLDFFGGVGGLASAIAGNTVVSSIGLPATLTSQGLGALGLSGLSFLGGIPVAAVGVLGITGAGYSAVKKIIDKKKETDNQSEKK